MQRYHDFIEKYHFDIISDYLFLIAFGLYVFWQQMAITMYGLYNLAWLTNTNAILLRLIIAGVISRILCHLNYRNGYNLNHTLAALASAGALFLCYHHLGDSSLLIFGLLILGAVGLDYRKLFSVYLVSFITTFSLALIGSAAGSITNLVYLFTRSDGVTYIRSAEGIAYTTDCAALLLFGVMTAWVCLDKATELAFLFVALAGAGFSYMVCDAQTSTILFLLLAVGAAMLLLYNWKLRKVGIFKWMASAVSYMMIGCPILAAGMVYAVNVLYVKEPDNQWLAKLNELTSGRLNLSANALENYGVHLLGTSFALISDGGSTSHSLGYNFIDSGYMLMLLRYGFLTLAVVVLGETYLLYRAAKERNYRLTLAVLIVVVHSIVEHHAMDMFDDSLLLLPYMLLGNRCHIRRVKWKPSILTVKRSLAFAACIVLLAISSSAIISALKTYSSLCGLNADNNPIGFIVLAVILGLAIGAIFAASIWIWTDRKLGLVSLLSGTVMIAVMTMGFCYVLSNASESNTVYAAALQDGDCMDLLKEKAPDAKIYSSDAPYLYRKLYGYTDLTWIPTEDLARCSDVTVIVDKTRDIAAFFSRGFCYCEISEDHAVYTNDQNVIDTLQNNGYRVTGYFSYNRQIDLVQLSIANNIPMDADGALVIASEGPNLKWGPWLENTEAGSYCVTYDLSFDADAIKELDLETVLCTLNVEAYQKEMTLETYNVTAGEVDEEGDLITSITFYDWSKFQDISFTLFNQGFCEIKINGISYQRVVDQDSRSTYNKKGQLMRRVYCDENGYPAPCADGYTSVTYEYDQYGEANVIAYYGQDEEPYTMANGYAKKVREYNKDKQLLREEYYGADGKRTSLIDGGYSAYEMDYDDNGNVIEYRYYGTDDQLIVSNDGYASVIYDRDENGNALQIITYGADGEKCLRDGTYAEIDQQFDENNRCIRLEYRDASGQLVNTTSGYAIIEYTYDADGNATETHYDVEGNAV